MRNVLGMILAGGRGTRLHPLTEHRAKPAVPFGGTYRLIDFTLSNCLNSGLRKIVVLTQYKSSSLTRHLNSAWNIFTRELGEYIEVLPPQKRIKEEWYQGTADAIYQNIFTIEGENPDDVFVFGGDHIYKMNYRKMLDDHREYGARATISVTDVPREEATAFGVLEVNEDFEVVGFQEKPEDPATIPDHPERSLVSMGIYCFDSASLCSRLREDAELPAEETKHDFGMDILPRMVESGDRVQAHWFEDENSGVESETSYWKDVGTVKSYYEANMDLVSVSPQFNLYDRDWPVRTYHGQYPPAKFVFDDDDRRGMAVDSIVSEGTIISGGRVRHSVISPGVYVDSGTRIENSIVMDGAKIGKDCKIKNSIIDKNATISDNTELGGEEDPDKDEHFRTEDGLVVVRRGYPEDVFGY
ncbi:MAG: glucose-1-phosphate adenylyltransferase [bacterium]